MNFVLGLGHVGCHNSGKLWHCKGTHGNILVKSHSDQKKIWALTGDIEAKELPI